MSSLGTLTIELIEAKFTRSTDLIRKMDPYVIFKSREFEWKSETCKNGAKTPQWQGAKFDIDVKYLGDDLSFVAKDQDRGRDEKIADGETKLSAFCVQADWDEWFTVEHKGKRAGKLHLKSHWAPLAAESTDNGGDEMAEVQQMMKDAVAKKRELTEQFNDVKDKMEEHEEENKKRLDEFHAGDKSAEWDKTAADIDAKNEADHEAAEDMKDCMEGNKAKFEEKIAKETQVAAEIRDATVERLDNAMVAAEEAKVAALAKADEDKAACDEGNTNARAEMEQKIADIELKDRVREEAIKDEIKETAEKLLKINEQIQEHLTALTQL